MGLGPVVSELYHGNGEKSSYQTYKTHKNCCC